MVIAHLGLLAPLKVLRWDELIPCAHELRVFEVESAHFVREVANIIGIPVVQVLVLSHRVIVRQKPPFVALLHEFVAQIHWESRGPES